MDAPVTRRELKQELAAFEQRIEERIDQRFAAQSELLRQHANAIMEHQRMLIGKRVARRR